MSDEATVRVSLQIRKDPIDYQGRPTVFTADVTGIKGPCPGAFTATVAGVSVDLSELTTPGLCRIMNLDDTDFVTFGIYDPETTIFYPLFEVLAGETYVLRLSRDLAEEWAATGTGTGGPETNTFHVRSNAGDCNVLVEAFEV